MFAKRIAGALFAGCLTLSPILAKAQNMQNLGITVPGGPGSGLDQVARAMEDALRKEGLVSSVSITNVPGGGGMIALSQFITTKGDDASAVVVQGAGTVFFPLTNATQVSLADVRPLARLAGEYEVIAVRTDSNIADFGQLMEKFKADPGSIAWGGGSPGSTENIFFARLGKIAGLEPRQVNFIPHPNTGEVVVSALNGQVTVVGGGLQDFLTQVESGKMRVLAVASPERLPGLDAPTLKELGYDLVFANWRGVSVHKKLPEADAKTIADHMQALVKSPRWHEILKERGWLDLYLPEAEYQTFIADETESAMEILTDLGIAK
ncbi:Bug family tripartite tricarboxylate transporter substrate binding protein [Aquamicrobium terrae]|uniref:Tricarboxylic transport membrane protein n=1 Tax=Aquamicrobium terrae TaxID=1324945 RepID=A0ABV2N6N6_9HYPH